LKSCPKCGAAHEKPGQYCSRSCANSRQFTKETNEKKSNANVNYYAQFTREERKQIHREKMSLYDFDEHQRKVQEANRRREWSKPYEEMSHTSARKRLLHERNYTCEECGIGNKYNGKPLSLELDHKDGNSKNNKVENLRILCPNCHSQTPTHRAKNIRYKKLLLEKALTNSHTDVILVG
jgi:5-methylcytosine-specific restriction endonuclease McrA